MTKDRFSSISKSKYLNAGRYASGLFEMSQEVDHIRQ